ncbi:MAG: hypothetical protein KKG33_05485 [candidate division Zixibacteria bacterium]|nr:hypothetical protein [candidate division Zixibacteria bacterium]MBU1470700.1 hypothetical protein [candidate division Zixibacteria bacterium]MBU2624994.1 hypothetical protein [candidate division Zixibacteria bacterium]
MLSRAKRFLERISVAAISNGNSGNLASAGGFYAKPRSKRLQRQNEFQLTYPCGADSHEVRIGLYRFLRDHVPLLNAAIWTWVRMAAGRPEFMLFDSNGEQTESAEVRAVVDSLARRLYDNRYQKFGGIDALLVEFFNTLFTTGSVCGELLVDASATGVQNFYFIDPATIRFKLERTGEWQMFQQIDDRRISLHAPSTYFYGLDANSIEPWGRSLLSAVPFASRVEQALVRDMHSSMHNAGYHRLHVKIKPPDRLAGEDQNAYVARANQYFDETLGMMKDIEPDDNPVTWDDVDIDYIGPASKISSSSSWYINHKAMIEDICAGTHLAPFMLGYSYGSSRTWAEFNFELLQRQLRTIQAAAVRFLRWITSVEFALKGISVECRWSFDDSISVGVLEKRQAEAIHIDNVIKKADAGLITTEIAKKELGCQS